MAIGYYKKKDDLKSRPFLEVIARRRYAAGYYCHFAFMSDNAIVGEIVGKLWGKDIENTSGSPFLGAKFVV